MDVQSLERQVAITGSYPTPAPDQHHVWADVRGEKLSIQQECSNREMSRKCRPWHRTRIVQVLQSSRSRASLCYARINGNPPPLLSAARSSLSRFHDASALARRRRPPQHGQSASPEHVSRDYCNPTTTPDFLRTPTKGPLFRFDSSRESAQASQGESLLLQLDWRMAR